MNSGFPPGKLLDLAATVTKMGVYYSNLTSQDIHETIFSCYIVTTKKDFKKRLCVYNHRNTRRTTLNNISSLTSAKLRHGKLQGL